MPEREGASGHDGIRRDLETIGDRDVTADLGIVHVETLDTRFEPKPWPFAEDNHERIMAHWAGITAQKPASFNGKVLMLHRWAIEGTVFRGGYRLVDYAAFVAWRDFGHPDRQAWNGFAMAALTSADGAFLLGEMAAHTTNAGQIYFAAGTPDKNDIDGDRVDLSRSVLREMTEETGLEPGDVTIEPGWTVVTLGQRVAFMRRIRSPLAATALQRRIETFLGREAMPELARMHVVASPADIVADRMPAFQRAYLDYALRRT